MSFWKSFWINFWMSFCKTFWLSSWRGHWTSFWTTPCTFIEKKAVAASALYGGALVPYGFQVACQRASCCRAMTAFLSG